MDVGHRRLGRKRGQGRRAATGTEGVGGDPALAQDAGVLGRPLEDRRLFGEAELAPVGVVFGNAGSMAARWLVSRYDSGRTSIVSMGFDRRNSRTKATGSPHPSFVIPSVAQRRSGTRRRHSVAKAMYSPSRCYRSREVSETGQALARRLVPGLRLAPLTCVRNDARKGAQCCHWISTA
jgi:hypothetical protein